MPVALPLPAQALQHNRFKTQTSQAQSARQDFAKKTKEKEEELEKKQKASCWVVESSLS